MRTRKRERSFKDKRKILYKLRLILSSEKPTVSIQDLGQLTRLRKDMTRLHVGKCFWSKLVIDLSPVHLEPFALRTATDIGWDHEELLEKNDSGELVRGMY